MEEYDFVIEYIKGKDNVAADTLSRMQVTSEELKEMSERIINVMTRNQRKKLEGEQVIHPNLPTLPNSTTNVRLDQPKVVEMLIKPSNSVELLLIS